MFAAGLIAANFQVVPRTDAAGLSPSPTVLHATRFVVTPPVRELASRPRLSLNTIEQPIAARPTLKPNMLAADAGAPPSYDPLVPTSPPPIGKMPAPLMTFEGLSAEDNKDVAAFRYIPSDANGDIGPNHYVQTVNAVYRVFDRQGTPAIPPMKYSTLFASLGDPAAKFDDGDPVVRYDSLADRWVISLFVVSDWFTTNGPAHQVIAVSKTPDPTGEFYVYDFPMPNDYLNDYPKLGIWPDGYYLSINQFNHDFEFVSAAVFACNRAKLLAGDSTAEMVFFDLQSFPHLPSSLLPGDLDGPAPTPGGANVFMCVTSEELTVQGPHERDNNAADAEADSNGAAPTSSLGYGLRVFQLVPNFADATQSTFAETTFIPTAPFRIFSWPNEFVPQRGVTNTLDSLSDRLMYRLQFRHFEDHDSLVVNHTVAVDTAPTAGLRFYELRRFPPAGAWFLHDEGTYSPDDQSRWMGSAALDWQGNLAIGYSASSIETFPSIRYAGRKGSRPAGGLNLSESTLFPGSASQLFWRWGDYTMLAVDPVDETTFWYVNQYYTTFDRAAWHTRIGTFRFSNTPSAPKATLAVQVVDDNSSQPIAGAIVTTANGYWRRTDSTNGCSFRLAPGPYTLFVSAEGYDSGTLSGVDLADGAQVSKQIRLVRVKHELQLLHPPEFNFSGPWHGPFEPESLLCTLTNLGTEPAQWAAFWDSSWLEVNPAKGVLEAGASADIELRLGAAAAALPPQGYHDTLIIANEAGGEIIEKPISLNIQRSPGTLAFDFAVRTALENDPFVTVGISRKNGTDGTIQVDVRTEDASAVAGKDYEPLNRTLIFAGGETNKQIAVKLFPATSPPSKSFKLRLTNPHNGAELGDLTETTIEILKQRGLIFREFFDADPRWKTEGAWQFGIPSGDTDPSAGNTGQNVYGYNLAGDYSNNLSQSEYLTSQPFDCSRYDKVSLYFWRWLGVERSSSDRATVEASNDGVQWTVVWTNSPSTFTRDTNWVLVASDISAVADRHSNVSVRWGMGPTDSSNTFTGWNIDDVEIYGAPTSLGLTGKYDASRAVDILTWASNTGHTFAVEMAPTLSQKFQTLASGIAATPPSNSFTNSVSGGTRFYRVRREQ